MRVLVTGSDGYIGSILCPMLERAGHDVVGLDTGLFQKMVLVVLSLEKITLRLR